MGRFCLPLLLAGGGGCPGKDKKRAVEDKAEERVKVRFGGEGKTRKIAKEKKTCTPSVLLLFFASMYQGICSSALRDKSAAFRYFSRLFASSFHQSRAPSAEARHGDVHVPVCLSEREDLPLASSRISTEKRICFASTRTSTVGRQKKRTRRRVHPTQSGGVKASDVEERHFLLPARRTFSCSSHPARPLSLLPVCTLAARTCASLLGSRCPGQAVADRPPSRVIAVEFDTGEAKHASCLFVSWAPVAAAGERRGKKKRREQQVIRERLEED